MTAFRSPLNLALLVALALLTGYGFARIGAAAVLPIRWGIDLSVTQWAPRDFALLQMPLATLLIWGVCWLFLRFGNAERVVRNERTVAIVLPVVTALFAGAQLAIVLAGLQSP